jgi:hypothetical protein
VAGVSWCRKVELPRPPEWGQIPSPRASAARGSAHMTLAAASRCPIPSSRRAVSRKLHGSSSTLPPPDTPTPMTATPADTEIRHGAVAFIVGAYASGTVRSVVVPPSAIATVATIARASPSNMPITSGFISRLFLLRLPTAMEGRHESLSASSLAMRCIRSARRLR